MAVPDYLQRPLSNLQNNYNLTDFSFPFPFQSLTPPLTPIEVEYHTFITNALYFAIPNFRTQIDNFYKNGMTAFIDGSTPMLTLYLLNITLSVFGGLLLHTLLVCRIVRVTNTAK
jgi:hypothetical protein